MFTFCTILLQAKIRRCGGHSIIPQSRWFFTADFSPCISHWYKDFTHIYWMGALRWHDYSSSFLWCFGGISRLHTVKLSLRASSMTITTTISAGAAATNGDEDDGSDDIDTKADCEDVETIKKLDSHRFFFGKNKQQSRRNNFQLHDMENAAPHRHTPRTHEHTTKATILWILFSFSLSIFRVVFSSSSVFVELSLPFRMFLFAVLFHIVSNFVSYVARCIHIWNREKVQIVATKWS